jgi:nitrate reductase assembly molybdenum cofactor insertion protein NarJ
MSLNAGVLEELGDLFRYPDGTYLERLVNCHARVVTEGFSRNAAAEFERLEAALAGKETWEIEELYTQAFDLNPVCALEIGWHLYGEQYERGNFLVRTRDLLAHLEILEVVELPDHLSLMLAALGRLEGEEQQAFAARFVVPALGRMAAGSRTNDNPMLRLIIVARELAERAAGGRPIEEAPPLRQDLVQIGSSRDSRTPVRATP